MSRKKTQKKPKQLAKDHNGPPELTLGQKIDALPEECKPTVEAVIQKIFSSLMPINHNRIFIVTTPGKDAAGKITRTHVSVTTARVSEEAANAEQVSQQN